MRYFSTLLLVVLFSLPASAEQAQTKRTLIVSIDGLRPDLLLLADCPTLRGLIARGSYSMWAQTTPSGLTLPSHTSMLTGVIVERHGIYWNRTEPPAEVDYKHPQTPTLFELAKAAGYTTAAVAGKQKFRTLNKPDTVDWFVVPQVSVVPDETVTESALAIINEHQPQVMFAHFGAVDTAGHAFGWGSQQQLKVIENADACLGRILDVLQAQGRLDGTLVIVSSDHGGLGKTHNGSDPRGLHIPWIAAGPGIKTNYDLTLERDLVIHTEDTFATACQHLGIKTPKYADGKPVRQAFD